MSGPTVDVVIAVHDSARPLRRAIDSVLDGAPSGVRVIVVRHGLPAESFGDLRDAKDASLVTRIGIAAGVRSAAGPFTAGVQAATAEYVGLLGSDDRFEAGALARMVGRVATDRPDVLVYPMRYDDGPPLANPLSRWRRERRLDPVRDRLAYRTAPLALFRRTLVDDLGLRFTPGVATGEDAEFSARLWFADVRIDFHPRDPGYVIMADAGTRVTMTARPFRQDLEAYRGLFDSDWIRGLGPRERHAFVVKTVRVHVLGALLARASGEAFSADDVAAARELAQMGVQLAPRMLDPFSRADRAVLDVLLDESTGPDRIRAVGAERGRASRVARWTPRAPWRIFDREGTLRRLVRYVTWPGRRQGTTT